MWTPSKSRRCVCLCVCVRICYSNLQVEAEECAAAAISSPSLSHLNALLPDHLSASSTAMAKRRSSGSTFEWISCLPTPLSRLCPPVSWTTGEEGGYSGASDLRLNATKKPALPSVVVNGSKTIYHRAGGRYIGLLLLLSLPFPPALVRSSDH